eukprot:Nk52_evm1s383 gene=Nk52_evmTU1s383
MCGIIAVLLANKNAHCSSELYEGLNLLQHRGQDAAGIVTCHRGQLFQCKRNGLVRDVFDGGQLLTLKGNMGVGHVRYPTAGTSNVSESQPFYVNSPYGLVLAHNGNLTNSAELSEYLDREAHRHVNTNSDSEMLLNILANELQSTNKFRIDQEDVFDAVRNAMQRVRGGYATVLMINGYGIVAFRDPHGIRPLVYGYRTATSTEGIDEGAELKRDFVLASESVALDCLGYKLEANVAPGEVVIYKMNGELVKRQVMPNTTLTPCIFEYVYFARPDSVIDNISVYKSRLAMGEALADKIQKCFSTEDIDVVIPVPDTSRVAAVQLSYKLRKMFREGFIKNRYVGRTFIMPGQQMRKKSVRRKLNPMPMEFCGKNVLLVDDSIVRGTTSKEIIQMVRECGAKKVFFASCAPEIRFPNVYGIDMPSVKELVAYGRSAEEVAQYIGADWVVFQDLDELVKCCNHYNPEIKSFDTSVFDGKYVTGDVTPEYLKGLEDLRNDSAKAKNGANDFAPLMVGLHNHDIALEK